MKKDYGWAYVDGIKRVICKSRPIRRGKDKGKIEVTLCRGRNKDGSIRQGVKVVIQEKSLVVSPPEKKKVEPLGNDGTRGKGGKQ